MSRKVAVESQSTQTTHQQKDGVTVNRQSQSRNIVSSQQPPRSSSIKHSQTSSSARRNKRRIQLKNKNKQQNMISSYCRSRSSYALVVAIAITVFTVVVVVSSSTRSPTFVTAFHIRSGDVFTATTTTTSTRSISSFADNVVRIAGHGRNTRYGGHCDLRPSSSSSSSSSTTTQLSMIGDLLNGIMGGNNNNSNNDGDKSRSSSSSDAGNNGGSAVVVDIPAKAVKVGPTKFYLQIYLVGEQNTPTQGSWFLKPNDETGSLDMYFGDGTAMLSIDVQGDYGIRISRQGSRPSLQYMLQESVLLHGILDELEVLAFGTGDDDGGGKEIKAEDRLLQLDGENQADVFSKARDALPARKEE